MILPCVRAVRGVAGQYNNPGSAGNGAGLAAIGVASHRISCRGQ